MDNPFMPTMDAHPRLRRPKRSTAVIVLLAIVWVISGGSAAHGATSAVSMAFAPDGSLMLLLGDRKIAAGGWTPFAWGDQLPAEELALGKPLHTRVERITPTSATVTLTYSGLVATCEYRLDGEDVNTILHLRNTDAAKTLRRVKVQGPAFDFARPPTGVLHSWHWTYLAAHGQDGQDLYHPSTATPLGAAFVGDDAFAFGAYTSACFESGTMFYAVWERDGIIPAHCQLQLLTDLSVSPGQTIDLDVHLRISADRSIPHLLAPYKAAFTERNPGLRYHPDNRAFAQFASVGSVHVSRTNPLGFNGDDRRFDTPIGSARFVNVIVPRLKRANALGCIFWALGGAHPRGAMYRPDFDVLPPTVAANVPALVNGFKSQGLRVGLCARPGEGVRPHDEKVDETYRLHAENPDEMKMTLDRFRKTMAMGFDVFYCDTFAMDRNDVKILRQIRDAVGPDVLLYTEYGSDLTLPLAGRYCEYGGLGVGDFPSPLYSALRFVCPDSTWLCMSRTEQPVPPEYAELGLVPLVQDHLVNALPATGPGVRK